MAAGAQTSWEKAFRETVWPARCTSRNMAVLAALGTGRWLIPQELLLSFTPAAVNPIDAITHGFLHTVLYAHCTTRNLSRMPPSLFAYTPVESDSELMPFPVMISSGGHGTAGPRAARFHQRVILEYRTGSD